MMPFPSNAMARGTTAGGGIGGGGTQRQFAVLTPYGMVFVNTSTNADEQYMLPNGAYLNEQGA